MRISGGLLGALLMASARSCGPPGWTPPPPYSSVVSEADQTYLVRYVPDDGGPSLVYEVPPRAFAKGFEAEERNGTFEVLEPDCTVVGSIPMQLLIGTGPETIIGSDGQPREPDVRLTTNAHRMTS